MRGFLVLSLIAAMVPAAARAAPSGPLPLLPMPASVEVGAGRFVVAGAAISVTDDGGKEAGSRLRDLVARSGGPALSFSARGAIRFRRDAGIKGAEAYRLVVTPAGATISAASDAGLYYGAETLWQLIASSPDGRIPAVTIADAPAFGWRGVMLDSARHFQPVSYVEQLIDRMAMAKLNTLHWHLSDDQGWRIEIDRYPRLTGIGGCRQEAGAAGTDPATGKPVRYCGYYTKAEIRAVVAYARAHHVTIVPEIDMPGHATAMVAAYPALASIPNPPKTPSNQWGVLPNLLDPDDATLGFVDNMLDEVMALFPGRYIHIGGDEAVKDQWKANPAIQAQIKRLGLKDENALQGWFMARLGDYLDKHGRRMIGWDEILEGQVPGDATVMSWHGIDGAITAARSGHDAILAPAPIFYLDNRQSDSPGEPPGRGAIIDWQKLYGFDPAPTELTADQRRHLLGLQVNLWTEHVRTTDYADRMIWPRAAILAELAWRNPAKDWPDFSARLVAAMTRWQHMGLRYDKAPLDVEARFSGSDDALTVALRQPAAIGTFRYTTDGSAPSPRSPAYQQPLSLSPGTPLMAQAFAGDVALGEPQRWLAAPELLRTRSASEMELCSDAIPLRLEDDGPTDGVRKIHWADIMHPCWIWRAAPLDGVTRLTATVGRQPFNFAIGDDIKKVVFEQPTTPAGELKVRRDGCDGTVIATVPLAAATDTSGDATVSGVIPPQHGAHDLCMTFAQTGPDPFWVLDRLTLGR
ncbi:family 20 glycosylhydrolase [Hephaestia mangrovi]|uniref:family 20 glycosylhydrolase n=1 Tax=Hephaestia mangrovi TaxID=2873268 RepID=UPI002104D05B|nr:family 20 glycosylhydrolase [Hephaestia mangrovi]